MFRNQRARDLACLLDLDPTVREWSCLPLVLRSGDVGHVPDFLVVRGEGACLVDAVETVEDPSTHWIEGEALRHDCTYERVAAHEIKAGARLANARDLLRYARWQCPLGDRVRLLAALEEQGSMAVAECMPAFRETPPIAGLSSLILHRFVEIDLDEARIGPETQVRRCRD
ncbi:hypothetical protein [Allomesorhizobium camelthorni]|nr:hypothetical protein [Mesorhizobium camelthorni]